MARWQLRPLPLTLFIATALLEAGAVGLSLGLEPTLSPLVWAACAVSLAGAGVLIASRQPRNAVGWLFCGFGIATAIGVDGARAWGLRAASEGWPGVQTADLLVGVSWLPIGLVLVLVYLLAPDGRLPSRRWAVVPILAGVGIAATVPDWVVVPLVSGSEVLPDAQLVSLASAAAAVGIATYLAMLLGAAASMLVRLRRSKGVERQQLKWFAGAFVLGAALLPLAFMFWRDMQLARIIAALALLPLPIAASIAILRHRLYDIDIVINSTLVYGALTIVLGAAFATTAIVAGTVLGNGSGWATAVATLVAAIAFRPLRTRIQDAVDRSFSRRRYEAARRVDAFLENLRAGRAAPEDVEGLLRELVGDPSLQLLFFLPEAGVYANAIGTPQRFGNRADAAIPIERAGEPFGMVLHNVTDDERLGLLRQAIVASGLAIEIARLRVELRRQLAEVDASRSRIVAAAHEERRRIERDLHDGAQQRLVSIGLAMRHAQHAIDGAGIAEARRTLDNAVGEIAVAISELRELARGLPPSQLDAGLAPAFEELSRRSPVPVEVHVTAERFSKGVETAAWFIGSEAVTNAVKHAGATRIVLTADRQHGRLVVSVGDDGIGGAEARRGSGLRGLGDRVASLGGTLRIESPQGRGTTLVAELPCGS